MADRLRARREPLHTRRLRDVAPRAARDGVGQVERGRRSMSVPAASTDKINFGASVPFFTIHIAAVIGIFVVPFRWSLLVWMLVSYVLRMWTVTAGYHRYFSHRSYEMGRVPQFLLGLFGTLAMQKGPLWWAAHHRWHHQHGD